MKKLQDYEKATLFLALWDTSSFPDALGSGNSPHAQINTLAMLSFDGDCEAARDALGRAGYTTTPDAEG